MNIAQTSLHLTFKNICLSRIPPEIRKTREQKLCSNIIDIVWQTSVRLS